jgi:hypothetical protein
VLRQFLKFKSPQTAEGTVSDRLAEIRQAVTETNQAVGDLKDTNEDGGAYLASPVPSDLGLRLLLDR